MMKKIYLTLLALFCTFSMTFGAQIGVYCFMAATGKEIYQDRNITAHILLTNNGTALLEVENHSDSIIFIDRGRSFSWINGESAPMFMPQSNTESQTYGHSTIDNDTPYSMAVIISESHTYSYTVYDQRILPIAPHGKGVVYAWNSLKNLLNSHIIDIGNDGGWFRYHCRGRFRDTGARFEKGDYRNYTDYDTPLRISADLEYSFDESGSDRHDAHVADYVSRISIGPRDGVSKNGVLLYNDASTSPCFAFRSGKPFGHSVGEFLSVASIVGLYVAVKNMNKTPDALKDMHLYDY